MLGQHLSRRQRKMLRLFERGLAYVGTDYRSNTLWDEYIKYEESLQAWSNLAVIYTRILEHPIQQLDRLKELAATQKLSEILTVEEAATYGVTTENCAQVLEGEPHPDGVDKYANPESVGLTETENSAKYVSIGEEMYKKAKEYESKIIGFELAIRRPYFHVKPLDNPELRIGTATLISLRENMTLIRYMLNAHPLRCSTHHLLSNVQHLPSSSSPVYNTAQPLCSSSSSPVYTCRRHPLRYSSSSSLASSPISLDRVVLMYFSFFLK